MRSNFLNIAQIKLNTIPNDSKFHAELKNLNPEPREDNFWERRLIVGLLISQKFWAK